MAHLCFARTRCLAPPAPPARRLTKAITLHTIRIREPLAARPAYLRFCRAWPRGSHKMPEPVLLLRARSGAAPSLSCWA